MFELQKLSIIIIIIPIAITEQTQRSFNFFDCLKSLCGNMTFQMCKEFIIVHQSLSAGGDKAVGCQDSQGF